MTGPKTLSIEALADGIAATASGPVFGIPGGGPSLELLDALERRHFPFVRTHFEGCAPLMAGTIGRLSGKPGVSLSIKGPGLANMVSGLAACALESFPLLALCEAFPKSIRWAERHKGMDHSGLVSAVSKGSFGLTGERVIENAVALAQTEIPGPVVLNLNDAEGPAVSSETADETLDEVVRHIEKAQAPVVIAGSLAVRSEWSSRLASLNIPVFVSAAAKGALDETLPHAAGVYTGVGLEHTPEHIILPKADLIVGLGLRAREVLVAKPFSCTAVNIDAVESDCSFAFSATTKSRDANTVFDALANHEWGGDLIGNTVAALDRKLLPAGFLPAHAFADIANYFGGNVRGVFDTGHFCTIAEHIWRPHNAGLCLMSGQGRYMGTGLPMALAAAIHDPSVPTVAVLGDGGIGMYLAEARIAATHGLPLLIVLVSDGGFGSVRTRALRDGLTSTPLLIKDPSWAAAMEGMGIPAAIVNSEDRLISALQSWDPVSGPCYVEITFDPEAYQDMISGIRG